MDDFLASLPDEDPPAASTGAPSPLDPTPNPPRFPPHAHSRQASVCAHADPFNQAVAVHNSSWQWLETRRGTHASATTSSSGTTLPALIHPQLHTPSPAANTAHAATQNANTLDRPQGQQQQPAFHLPCIPQHTPSSMASESSAGCSLPPVHPSPMDVSSSAVGATEAPVESPAGVAASAAGGGESAGGGGERSARVSRASSSVRSEQSVGSLSPEKTAAKEQRHKVKIPPCIQVYRCGARPHAERAT